MRPLNTAGEGFQRWGLFVRNTSKVRSHVVGFFITCTRLCWLVKSRILSLLISPAMMIFASGSADKIDRNIHLDGLGDLHHYKLDQVGGTLLQHST